MDDDEYVGVDDGIDDDNVDGIDDDNVDGIDDGIDDDNVDVHLL